MNNKLKPLEYNFEREDDTYNYSCKVTVKVTKKPENKDKLSELTDLVRSLEGLKPFERSRLEKTKRISDLVRDIAPEYGYKFERTIGPDYQVYTRRLGDVCDVLVDCCGKVAYNRLDLRMPIKHKHYDNVVKILSQKKEVKKFAKTFWTIEENFFLGTLGQRLVSYLALNMLGGIAGMTYGLSSYQFFFTSLLYGGMGSALALAGIVVDHYNYKRKVKKAFKKYSPNIFYNKQAFEKAFSYKPSKGVLK